jgi:hypothetical protein
MIIEDSKINSPHIAVNRARMKQFGASGHIMPHLGVYRTQCPPFDANSRHAARIPGRTRTFPRAAYWTTAAVYG